ncbi:hypothetical protein GKC56_01620 [Neisseriaceae bacterium PsAf]|nr:hypothetical protein [Neisseriaceae bacterium PsAf]
MNYEQQDGIWYPFYRGVFDFTKSKTSRSQYWITIGISIVLSIIFLLICTFFMGMADSISSSAGGEESIVAYLLYGIVCCMELDLFYSLLALYISIF